MAEWSMDRSSDLNWGKPISAKESKNAIALRLADRLRPGDVVGVGSGSTSFLTLQALAHRAANEGIQFDAVATSIEMERACAAMGVRVLSLAAARPDWSFDGADEIDGEGRIIKGRGGAIFREKLVMAASRERHIIADASKFVSKLGTKFPLPVEVVPYAVELVCERLRDLGAVSSQIRRAGGKDGPILTEFRGVILDVRFAGDFPSEMVLESIPGVLATGLFEQWEYSVVTLEK